MPIGSPQDSDMPLDSQVGLRARRGPDLVVAALLLFLLGAAAPGLSAPLIEQGLLFRIEPPGAPAPSYLFGTIHSEDARILNLPPPVRDAFEQCATFALEVIPDARAIVQSMVTMTYTDGRRLADGLTPDLYREALAALAARGMPEPAVEDFKPWAVLILLGIPPGRTGLFLDMALYQQALAQRKTIIGLETIEEQLGIFANLSDADQIALLRETLAAQPLMPAIFERLIGAYLERDLGTLERLGDTYLQGGDTALAERFRATAIDARNARMHERLRPLLKHGNHFIAVGALHLAGEQGLLARLIRDGCRIDPVY